MYALLLALVSAAWICLGPAALSRVQGFRRAPGSGLLAWQCVTVGGILAALATAPAAIPDLVGDRVDENPGIAAIAVVVSAVVLLRLLVSGHLVGTRLRAARRRHRELVDILGESVDSTVRVLPHQMPTAYCIPGHGSRLVLSQGILDSLEEGELEAVLAHERAHLRSRHDLLLEFFAVADRAVPARIRSARGTNEVRLLVEALADRAAVRTRGDVTTARALVALAGARSPEGALGSGASVKTRLELVAAGPDRRHELVAFAVAATAVLIPAALVAAAWS